MNFQYGGFCPNCGQGMQNGVCPACSFQSNNGIPTGNTPIPGIFVSTDEKPMYALGGYYPENSNSARDYCVISDRRIYFKGTSRPTTTTKASAYSIIDLKSVSSATRITRTTPACIFFAALFAIAAMFFFAYSVVAAGYVMSIVAVAFFIGYYLMKTRLFVIEHSGGSIIFQESGYSSADFDALQRHIHYIKDNMR